MDIIEQITDLLEEEYKRFEALRDYDDDPERLIEEQEAFEKFRESNQEEIEKLNKQFEESQLQEDDFNIKSDLLKKFIEYYDKGFDNEKISKKFKESELIEICEELGEPASTSGTKVEKVQTIITLI